MDRLDPPGPDRSPDGGAVVIDRPPRETAAQPLRRLLLFGAVVAAVLAVDQATKALVRGWLAQGESWPNGEGLIRLTHVENAGAAFGILQGAGPFLIVTTLIAIFAILAFFVWAPPQSRLHVVALAFVLGGAVGNLVDRVVRGTVTDFIDPTNYPSFNIADSAIVTGVAALVVLSLFEGEPEQSQASGDRAEHGPERAERRGEQAG